MSTGAAEPEGPLGVPGGAVRTPAGAARHRAVLDSLDEVVFQTDAEGRWTYLNQAWTAITGFDVAESLGQPFLSFLHPDEVEPTVQLFRDVVDGGLSHCQHETRYRTADGGHVDVELRASVLRDPDGTIAANVGTILDITQRRRLEDLLAEQTRLLELIAEGTPLEEMLGALAGSLARHLGALVVLASTEALSGAGAGEEPSPQAVGSPDGTSRIYRSAAGRRSGEALVWPSRRTVVVEVGGEAVATIDLHHPDPELPMDAVARQCVQRCTRLVTVAVLRQRAEREVRHRAFHDPLTGLPNRALVADRLEQALAAARRRQRWLGLVLLDLDHFKDVNDTLGHEVGDHVLRTVGERLRGAVRSADTVARLGGDEFVVVLTDLARAEDAHHLAGALVDSLRDPVPVGDLPLEISASVGVAVSLGAEKDLAALFREADVAMYRAKQQGGGHVLFDSRRDEPRLNRIGLAADLRHAIPAEQLFLDYQPKVSLADGRAAGLEGLVRWQHPARGLIPPADFIPMAEATGSIAPLSVWVLREALRQCRRWAVAGSATSVAINLSAPMLHDPELPALVDQALAAAQLPPERLELEITESAVMANPEAARAVMRRMARAGVTFALDDFGTGYSSLTYLKRLPVRAIKIDRSFVRDMAGDERDGAIVHSVIDLAHNLGMEVVAEGVETEAVRHRLGELGCDVAQGYLFARPLAVADVPGWLAGAATA